MKRTLFVAAAIAIAATAPMHAAGAPTASHPHLPYTFEKNQGQAPGSVRFLAHGEGYGLFLTGREAVLTLSRGDDTRQIIRMSLAGSQGAQSIEGQDDKPQTTNYLIGADRTQWRTNVPHFGRVRYGQVYNGVDLVYHSAQDRLEYDFVLSPGASAGVIGLEFAGADKIRVTPEGALELGFGSRRLLHQAPVAYQECAGRRDLVQVAYQMRGKDLVGFRLGAYDHSRPLVIDPVVVYSTFLGGDRTDSVSAVAVDAQGNTYVTGESTSLNFPVTGSGVAKIQGAVVFSFVTKLNAAGTAIVYSTLLGGSSNTRGYAIAVDRDGNAYAAGVTGARDFPMVNAVQTTQPGLNIGYIAKLNPQGNALLFSTYIGGERNDEVRALALDAAGNIHITGRTSSTTFPTVNAMQPAFGGNTDAFVAMYAAPNYRLAYSTYFGKAGVEEANGMAVDAGGSVYLVGLAGSEGMATAGAYQSRVISPNDAFVAKINASGTQLEWFTYYGGRGDDKGYAIALDASGNVIVGGSATSNNLPVTSSALQKELRGDSDAFLAVFSGNGRDLVYGSYLGSSSTRTGVTEAIYGLAVDAMGSIHAAGVTNGADFPAVRPIQSYGGGASDGFVAKFTPGLGGFAYSTVIGGSANDSILGMALDATGGVHIGGETESQNFPLKNAIRSTFASAQEAFVTHICDPMLVMSSSTLTFTYVPQQAVPQPQTLQVGACTPIPYTVEVQGAFLSATPIGGTTNGTVTVSVQPGNLAPGIYRGELKFTAPDAVNSPVTVAVTLRVAPPPPVISATAIVHAGTGLAGPIAPGELVVVYGKNLGPNQLAMATLDETGKVSTQVEGARIFFDGVPAPVVYTSTGQMSVVVPYSVSGKAATKVEAEYLGVRSNAVNAVVGQAAPGIFTANSSGTGQGAVLNQDFTANNTENPAERGAVIVIYATGEGQVDPGGVDGILSNAVLPNPVQPVSVTVGGVSANILYAGAAPGLVAGVLQINATVPPQIAAGAAEVKVMVGAATSPSGVTIAVK
jgi:uncharacterized protein (TIGR03437 family)